MGGGAGRASRWSNGRKPPIPSNRKITPERLSSTKPSAKAVRDAIATLPTDLCEALVLFEYEQMSRAEIADALGVTAKVVENRIARAREKLRAALNWWA